MKKVSFLLLFFTVFICVFSLSALANDSLSPSDWAISEVSAAREIGLFTDKTSLNYQKNITREEFCELVVKLYIKLTNKIPTADDAIFSDTNNPEILKAYNLGIVKGISETEFAPSNHITRQEICVMLSRCIDKAIDSANVNIYDATKFTDNAKIANWALPSVNYIYTNGIIKGVGEKEINPLGNTTCEQAIMLVYRTYQNKSNLEVSVLDGGKCGDNLNWELLSNGVLHISGTGPMYDYVKFGNKEATWYKYRNEPFISADGKTILNTDGTEYLAASSYFANNPNNYKITQFIIDEGITYIGDWAFYRICVEELTIPEGVESTGYYCIRYSPTLKTVNLPDSLKLLNDLAISRNYVLETINFGNGLTTIGAAAFAGNYKLKAAILPDSVTSVGTQLHSGFLGETLDKSGLFESCSSLKVVSLGSIDKIPQRMFLRCRSIEKVIIPNTVASIGTYAFGYCNSLKSVEFQSNSTCKDIESYAFYECTALESITGGTAIEVIRSNAFAMNGKPSSLSLFEFSDSNKEFPFNLFGNKPLRSATIGNNVADVPSMCFYQSSINELYISKNVKNIAQSAFSGCTSLQNIYYGGTLEEWNNITKADYSFGGVPNTCVVHFSDGTSDLIKNVK